MISNENIRCFHKVLGFQNKTFISFMVFTTPGYEIFRQNPKLIAKKWPREYVISKSPEA